MASNGSMLGPCCLAQCPFCLTRWQGSMNGTSCCSQFDISLVQALRRANAFAAKFPEEYGSCFLCKSSVHDLCVFCWEFQCWMRNAYMPNSSNPTWFAELHKKALQPGERHRVPTLAGASTLAGAIPEFVTGAGQGSLGSLRRVLRHATFQGALRILLRQGA